MRVFAVGQIPDGKLSWSNKTPEPRLIFARLGYNIALVSFAQFPSKYTNSPDVLVGFIFPRNGQMTSQKCILTLDGWSCLHNMTLNGCYIWLNAGSWHCKQTATAWIHTGCWHAADLQLTLTDRSRDTILKKPCLGGEISYEGIEINGVTLSEEAVHYVSI